MSDPTKDQIAAVMLLRGTPEQQKSAIEYCSTPVAPPAPQEVAGVELREKFYRNLSTDTLISTLITVVQERDVLKADKAHYEKVIEDRSREAHQWWSALQVATARVAELEGDVARDAARWQHCKKHGVPVFGLSEVTGTPSLWRAQAFGRSYIADSLQEAVDMAIAAAKEPK